MTEGFLASSVAAEDDANKYTTTFYLEGGDRYNTEAYETTLLTADASALVF